mmetsp:Transcript_9168/g.20441  ORF Transcript_9168/g.20441 Transcript_9168/m.20441 type:complete len:464 (-) Transcript_9168:646-2037(-)
MRRIPPQHRRDCRRDARRDKPRRHVDLLLARLRRARGRRPLRTGEAEGAVHDGRLRLRGEAHLDRREGGGAGGGAAFAREGCGHRTARRASRLAKRAAALSRRQLGRFRRRRACPRRRVHPRGLLPPAVCPLLVGHNRHAEEHRARRGEHAAAARQGADAPLRPAADRPHALLHHVRLDDVELDDLLALRRRGGRLLRRLRRLSQARLAVGPDRARAHHSPGIVAALLPGMPRARASDGAERPLGAPRDLLDRLAALPGGLRVRVREGEGRRDARLHLGRHRHLLVLRAGQPDAPRAEGRAAGLRPRPRRVRDGPRRRQCGRRRQGRAGVPLAVRRGARLLLRRRRGEEQVPRRLLRGRRRHVVPRRPRRGDRLQRRVRRRRDPRPLGHHSQARRRADRHGGGVSLRGDGGGDRGLARDRRPDQDRQARGRRADRALRQAGGGRRARRQAGGGDTRGHPLGGV